jgi:CBS domain-containing protein
LAEEDIGHKALNDIRIIDLLEDARRSRPETVGPDATIKEAAAAMLKSKSRKVYVVDSEKRLLGTITLETLLRHAGYTLGVRKTGIGSFFKMLSDIGDEKASQAMVDSVKISPDELLVNAAKLMVDNHLNDLPIVGPKNELLGELDGIEIIKLAGKL